MSSPLVREVEVRCSIDHAFAVFTQRIHLWWPPSHRKHADSRMIIEGRVGGRFFERTPSGNESELGTVLLWEPPQRVRYSWWPGANAKPTEVDVVFRAAGDVTRVEVTHSEGASGLGELWPERAKLFERGWGAVLPAFAAAIGGEEA